MSTHKKAQLDLKFPKLSPAEEAAARQAARDVVTGWLEFSTLRYYALGVETMQVEEAGDVLVRLVLRVPRFEVRVKHGKEPSVPRTPHQQATAWKTPRKEQGSE